MNLKRKIIMMTCTKKFAKRKNYKTQFQNISILKDEIEKNKITKKIT